jgi:predicted deacylase
VATNRSKTAFHLRSHQFYGLDPAPNSPRFAVLGAVHGNEICGPLAIERLLRELESGERKIKRGVLTLVPVANPLAYAKGERNGDRNLNRNLQPLQDPHDFEDHLAHALCPILAAQDVVLDLHSTTNPPGEPFIMLGPPNNREALAPFSRADEEEALALRLGPTRIVEGWLDTFAQGVKERLAYTPTNERAHLLSTDPSYGIGTTEYTRKFGGYALTLECGQHQDPAAPEIAYRAIINALVHLQMIDGDPPPVQESFEFLRISEVVDRHHLGDDFARQWSSFDRVKKGEVIAHRSDQRPVRAPCDGMILFPNPNATPGNEWFYFARPSSRSISGRFGRTRGQRDS